MWNAMFKPGLTVTSNNLRFLSVPINLRSTHITVYFRHAGRDIVVSDWSSGKKSNETDCDETGTKLEAF